MINQLVIYPALTLITLLIINYILFIKKFNKNIDLYGIKEVKNLKFKLLIITNIIFIVALYQISFWLIINMKASLLNELPIQSINIFNIFQYIAIIFSAIVIYIFFYMINKNIEKIVKNFKILNNYYVSAIFWIVISGSPQIVWLIILFRNLA